jgi:hypothetical protein
MSRFRQRMKMHRRTDRSVEEWRRNMDGIGRAVSGYDMAERIAAEAASRRRSSGRSAA